MRKKASREQKQRYKAAINVGFHLENFHPENPQSLPIRKYAGFSG
jgi:hypothetical protein